MREAKIKQDKTSTQHHSIDPFLVVGSLSVSNDETKGQSNILVRSQKSTFSVVEVHSLAKAFNSEIKYLL